MQVKSLLSAGFGAFALTFLTTTAQAGPTGLTNAIDQSVGGSALVEKVTWYGDRSYGRYHRPYYGYRWYRHNKYGKYGHRHYDYGWYGRRHYGWYPRYGSRHW
jgi:hypothetical protein